MAEVISQVKEEPGQTESLEERIIQLCEKNPVGISNQLLLAAIPAINKAETVGAINNLLSRGKLEIFKKGKQILYKVKNPNTALKCKDAGNEEKLIYQIIENARNMGIGNKEIKYKSNLTLPQVNKILKNFESKKIIKSIVSVCADTKKKLFMLYDTVPDHSITGGPWYGEDGFDSEFVEVLNRQCHTYLQEVKAIAENRSGDPLAQRNASFKSSKEIWKFINELKISRVQLTIEHVESILTMLIYDSKVEKKVIAAASTEDSTGILKLYKAVDLLVPSAGISRMPCGTCPISDDCREGTAISPSTCQYMKEWLEF